jgi:hypothetical protein
MRPRRPSPRAAFTLAEVAITLLIVSIGLVLVLEGLMRAKLSAAETHHRKVARELALLTLGQVEAGLFWEELDARGDVLTGSYAEEDYEDFHYELVLGEGSFLEDDSSYDGQRAYHDSWSYEREREARARERAGEEEDDEETVEPFEKVRIKVVYPQLGERPSSLVLERWVPWKQVYGDEGDAAAAPAEDAE